MSVNWLIETQVFPTNEASLVAEIPRQGMTVKLLPDIPPGYRWEDLGQSMYDLFPPKTCVLFYGSLGFGQRLQKEMPWTPSLFYHPQRYHCLHYYPRLGEFLLQQDYICLPFGELLRCQKFLFDTLGFEEQLFLRPASERKWFAGQLAHRDRFPAEVEDMAFYEIPPEEVIVVSRPRSIEREWRFVIAEQCVLTGSLYRERGELVRSAEIDPGARSYAASVAATGFEPDPLWILDICLTSDGDYHLLEVGCFSCCDLYACDQRLVVETASRLAWDKHQKALH